MDLKDLFIEISIILTDNSSPEKIVLNSSFQGIKGLFVLAFSNAYGEC